MLTSKDLTTLNFLEFSSNGRRYIRAYKNEWVSKKVTGKDKGVSRTKEQHHAGSLVDQYRVRLSPKFLAKFPEFAGKQWFYENNLLKVSTLWGLSPKTKRGREPSFAYGQSNVLPGQPSASP